MNRKTKEIVLIIIATLASTICLWLPFFSNQAKFLGFPIPSGGMKTIFANYDGPNYIIIAKTWYETSLIASLFSLPLPLEYYPAHFPAYPFLIRIIGFLLPFTQAMISATVLTSVAAALIFYLFLNHFKLSQNPFWLTLIFLFLPARFFIVRSVGAPESLFIFAILASFYFFKEKKYWLAALFGSLAQVTKTPAILLFAAYIIYLFYQTHQEGNRSVRQIISQVLPRALPLFLIPLSALGVFGFYLYRTGDFWAYFHSGDNFHLTPFPFQSFNSNRNWLGDIWNEDMVWLYLLSAIGVILLFKRKLIDLSIFAAVFYLATVFVAHRDLSRYSLPFFPFLLIGFDPLLQRKEFKIAFLIILPAIYLYALNFIIGNRAPVADWRPYL